MKLCIKPHEKVEIHYSDNVLTLENYFSLNYADNVKYIEKIELLAFISSKITNIRHLFERWNSLEPFNLTEFNYSSVKDMSYIFSECLFESIDLSNLDIPEVEDISHMFEGYSSLKEINFTTEKVKDMSYMFSDCILLESVDLSNFSTPNLLNMTKMFYKCEKLEYLNLSTFNTDKVNDMSFIFYGMNALKYLDISNFNMSQCNLFNNIFSNISNIRYINIQNLNNDKAISNSFNNNKMIYFMFVNHSLFQIIQMLINVVYII